MRFLCVAAMLFRDVSCIRTGPEIYDLYTVAEGGLKMALTETAIRAAKPREKEYNLSDGDGLLLMVGEKGAKRWVLRYWVNGKERRAGLGSYPEIGLADAREKKFQFKRELALGGNPQERKKAEREAAVKEEEAKTMTFARVAAEWLEKRMVGKSSDKYLKTLRLRLDRLILPSIGNMALEDLTSSNAG